MCMQTDQSEVFKLQTEIVVNQLVKNNSMTRELALRTWMGSKTWQMVQGANAPFSFISPARCYDELCKEMENNPFWMSGTFD